MHDWTVLLCFRGGGNLEDFVYIFRNEALIKITMSQACTKVVYNNYFIIKKIIVNLETSI